jgi:signal transduction histidine kinase
MEESKDLVRKTGIDALGDVSWGTHFSAFYQNKEDLIEILVPYFKAGLENNEFCMWVTSEPLGKKEAEKAIRKAVPNFHEYLKRGQIEILPHSEWYLKDGTFDPQAVLKGWSNRLDRALARGYAGMRVTGNTMWLEKRLWRSFADYEHEINESIHRYRMLVLCTYCLDKCGPLEIIDVVNNHQLVLVKQEGKWALTKNAERMRAEQRAMKYQEQLRSLASELALIEEREKRRIAKDLQDCISQTLVISKIKLDALRHCACGKELKDALAEICNHLGQTVEQTRSLAFDLSSPILHELGFEAGVANWLSAEIEKKHGIRTEFEDDGQPKPLSDDISLLLFRDVRELLNNILEHADAHEVKISIRKVGRQICVSVEDDGVGFDPVEVAARAAEFGLFGIRQRLDCLGGHLEIESKPGHGCKVTMKAPLKHDGT